MTYHTMTEWYAAILAREKAKRESDTEVARLAGQTIAQFDADTTERDPEPPEFPFGEFDNGGHWRGE